MREDLVPSKEPEKRSSRKVNREDIGDDEISNKKVRRNTDREEETATPHKRPAPK